MKNVFFTAILFALGAQAQIENKTVETQFDLTTPIENRTIDSKTTMPEEAILKDKASSTFVSFSKKYEAGNLKCELSLTTMEKDLDYVQIKTRSGWEGKEIKSTHVVRNQDALVQKVSISFSLNKPDAKSVLLICEREIGKLVSSVAGCPESKYDEKIFGTTRVISCKGTTKPITYNELTDAVSVYLGMDLHFNTVIKTNYKVLTVKAGEIPAG